ncbi:MAG: 2Fe-2S iron-sulfur cluster-binding protein [Gammaproteobacteria bacterium]
MLGFLKSRKQDWSAEILPAGRRVEVRAGDNLLKAALEAGLAWPHDCRVGSCGTCRCTLKEGRIKPLSDFSYVLDGEQLNAGMILACQTSPRSDLVVEVALDAENAVSVTSNPGVIKAIDRLTHDIVELSVNINGASPPEYIAGQYAELAVQGIEKPRSYSFARAPGDKSGCDLTFFVRRVPGGEFTEWLFGGDRTGTALTISAPYGAFWLRPGKQPIVCVAGGSGLAPIKALLEAAHDAAIQRDVTFLFGARTQKDLYCLDAMETLESAWSGERFEFVPVLSEEPSDSDWGGARGLVTDYLQKHYVDTGAIDMKACQGYLCGPPPMIDAAIAVMNAAGLSDERIFFDKFLDASTMPAGR